MCCEGGLVWTGGWGGCPSVHGGLCVMWAWWLGWLSLGAWGAVCCMGLVAGVVVPRCMGGLCVV